MRTEGTTRIANPAFTCAAIVFGVVLLLGGGLGQWIAFRLEAMAEESARRDARVLAESLGRTLSAQFGKAARLGIPYSELPGVEPFLRESVKSTPGVASLSLVGPDGQAVSSARAEGTASRERDRVEVVIPGESGPAGKIVVATAPAALAEASSAAHWWSALAALVAAVLASALAYVGPGRNFARRQQLLLSGLRGNLASENLDLEHFGDDLDAALEAWAEGERGVAERRAALDALAQELRAVDFDDAMRPAIEQITREVDEAMAGGAR